MQTKLSFFSALVALCLSAMTLSAAGLQAPGKFYIKSVLTGKYVILQSQYLADITADAGQAEVINVDYDLQNNGEGIVTTLNSDNGDMIATLGMIRTGFESLLTDYNYSTDFLDEMFTLHLAPTGDADGSVYLCVDVPEIDNWEEIKAFLLEKAGNVDAIRYYLTYMYPGNRHYLAVDYDDSFGFRVQAGEDCKWLMIPIVNTAINQISDEKNNDTQMYDINGRKLTAPMGFFIQGGKKFIVR